MTNALNQWGVLWADYMGRTFLETAVVLVVVVCLWLVIQKRASAQLGCCLFLLVLLKPLVPWEISLPSSLSFVSPGYSARNAILGTSPETGLFPTLAQPTNSVSLPPPPPSIDNKNAPAAPLNNSTNSIPAKLENDTVPLLFSAQLMLLWFGISLVLLSGFLYIQWRMNRIMQTAYPVDASVLNLDLERLKQAMGIKKAVALRTHPDLHIPITWGIFQPAIIVPAALPDELSSRQIEWILLHELAHIRRQDLWVVCWQKLMQILFFFNPAIWLANWMINHLREYACDDMALASCRATRAECSEGLLSLIERANGLFPVLNITMGFLNSKTRVRRRMMRILDSKRKLQVGLSAGAMALLLGAALLVLPTVRAGERIPPKIALTTDEIQASTTAEVKEAGTVDPKISFPAVTLRLIQKGHYSDFTSLPSLDGKYVCDQDQSQDPCPLVVREIATGEVRTLTQGTYGETWEYTISPDNQYVAYGWYNYDKQTQNEVRLIGLDGSNPHVIYSNPNAQWITPLQWSSDGKKILARSYAEDGTVEILFISTMDGSVQTLRSMGKHNATVVLSPDQRFLAYDYPQQQNEPICDIFLYDILKNKEIPFIQHPAEDRLLGWSPDGKWILFCSDRWGNLDAYINRVSDGKPISYPERIMNDIGKITPKGFINNGSFYYKIEYRFPDIYFAKFDFETGTFQDLPTLIPSKGDKWGAEWSHDGQHVIYANSPPQTVNSKQEYEAIPCIYSMASGETRQLPLPLIRCGKFRWTSDDQFIYCRGYEKKGDPFGIYKIDVKTSAVSTVVKSASGIEPLIVECSPDGGKIYYSEVNHANKSAKYIVELDLKTGERKELFSDPDLEFHMMNNMVLSKDGKWLAFEMRNRDKDMTTLNVISPAGGEKVELAKFPGKAGGIMWIEAMPDGKHLVFLVKEDEKTSLWKIAITGGTATKLWTTDKWIHYLRIHPEGKQVAFNMLDYMNEVWVMENFLPKD